MKISKLFHSLYALLMLAPVFAVGGAMAFNIINDKAVDIAQNEDITYQKINYQYDTNEVFSLDDLVIGNIYLLRFQNITLSVDNGAYLQLFTQDSFEIVYNFFDFDISNSSYSFLIRPYFEKSSAFAKLISSPVESISFYFGGLTYTNCFLPVIFKSLTGYNYQAGYSYLTSCPNQFIPYTLEDVNITYPDNLSDNFYFALDTMNNSEVFSWAKTSFIAEPFSYIFGLFGIPTGSPFITLLSYWLSISVIWLVFDLIMYVPLLVHGWIDKGVIE